MCIKEFQRYTSDINLLLTIFNLFLLMFSIFLWQDYTGEDVTVDNFLAVILGNKTALKGGSGKVVDSGPNDRIFIYYTDHGGPGVLG